MFKKRRSLSLKRTMTKAKNGGLLRFLIWASLAGQSHLISGSQSGFTQDERLGRCIKSLFHTLNLGLTSQNAPNQPQNVEFRCDCPGLSCSFIHYLTDLNLSNDNSKMGFC